MDADSVVGVLGPSAGDRLGDRHVLGQRHLGAAGPLRELELVPHELRVQPVEQPDRDGLSGDDTDPAVQFPVELGVLQRIALRDRALEVLREFEQLREARDIIRHEAQSLDELSRRLDGVFTRAVALISECRGAIIVTGMGKAGLIGRKVAATFSSTGTRALFLHPAEALAGA